MQKVTNEDLIKISEFINSIDGLINGKFILADIKISNLLKMIASNNSLYSYIKSCLIDFSFDKELSRAEVKNRFNNGEFRLPQEKNKIVAFVFCLLVECDAKRMDFYGFINENFTENKNGSEYANFANTILIPFKEIIVNEFYSEEEDEKEIEKKEIENTVEEKEDDIFNELKLILDEMKENVSIDRKIKSQDKENINYIISSIIYSMKYKDLNIVNGFVTVLDILAEKHSALRIPLKDIKSKLFTYYKL